MPRMQADEMLGNIPLFEDLSPEDLTALAERMKRHVFEKGQSIFQPYCQLKNLHLDILI